MRIAGSCRLLAVAAAAAAAAGSTGIRAIASTRAAQTDSWDVERKADESPLTRADRDANAVICEGLARIGEAGVFFAPA